MTAVKFEILREHVHRPAFAFDTTALFAVKLRHYAFRRHPLDYRLNMIAIRRYDHIGRFEGHHRADADGFLADIQMTKTADHSHTVNFGAFFLESAPKHHLIEHFLKEFLVRFLDRLELRLFTGLVFGNGLLDLDKVRKRFTRNRFFGLVAIAVRGCLRRLWGPVSLLLLFLARSNPP